MTDDWTPVTYDQVKEGDTVRLTWDSLGTHYVVTGTAKPDRDGKLRVGIYPLEDKEGSMEVAEPDWRKALVIRVGSTLYAQANTGLDEHHRPVPRWVLVGGSAYWKSDDDIARSARRWSVPPRIVIGPQGEVVA